MARNKKYKTEKAFQKAVDGYFDAISRIVPVNEISSHDALPRRVKSASGSIMHHREYLIPPSISSLCLHIGISRQTFSEYSECYSEVVADARLKIECYLEEQLLTRRKGVQGIIFNLQNNYGWREKKEVELGDKTRRDVLDGMSVEEKIALIRSAENLIADENEKESES